jgi:hypothetical protein
MTAGKVILAVFSVKNVILLEIARHILLGPSDVNSATLKQFHLPQTVVSTLLIRRATQEKAGNL